MKLVRTNQIILAICFPILTFLSGCQPHFLKDAGVDEKTNPHRNEKCFVCHTASKDLLTKEKPAENEFTQIKLMRADLVNLCAKCHKAQAELRHPVGIPTKLNRESLPLNQQGNITCAITCHNVHTKDIDLAKKMLRRPFNSLCLSCHDI